MRRAAANVACFLLAAALLAGSASAMTLQTRVVGGIDAAATDAPWQALVLPGSYLCGGSVLDARHVATAAHCVFDDTGARFAPADIEVFAGITDIAARYDGQHPAVEQVDVDPGYSTSTYQDDIAVLTLAAPGFDLSGATPQAIALPDPGFSPTATDDLVVSGWGTTAARSPYDNSTNTDPISYILQKATVHTSTECTSAYGWRYSAAKQICAGQAGTDACQGDSGGPLAMNLHGTWTLVGTVSSGAGCAWDQFPGLYTRMSATTVRSFVAGILGQPVSTAAPAPSSNVVTTTTVTTPTPAPAPAPAPVPTVTTAPAPAEPIATTATAPPADLAAPASRITRVRCSHRTRRCVLTVRVSDAAPSDGIARVDARVRTKRSSRCRRHGRRVRCTRTVTRRLRVVRLHAGTYRVTTARLTRGRQRFEVLATDAAGHRQRRAAVRSAWVR